MNSKLATISLVSCTLLLVGCGDAEPDPEPTPTPEVKPSAALVGKWRSGCSLAQDGASKSTLDFELTETTWKLDYALFAPGGGENVCEYKAATLHIEGAYRLGAESMAVPGAKEGEFDFDVRTVTPHSAGVADINLPALCEGGTYIVDMPTDILAGCAGLGVYPVAECPTDYDIVKVEGNTLQFGLRPMDNNMCTPEKRPTALGVPLTKQ